MDEVSPSKILQHLFQFVIYEGSSNNVFKTALYFYKAFLAIIKLTKIDHFK